MFDLSKLASIKIGLASPEVIKSWSYAEKQKPGSGEVKKSETINYRSQKPEPEGLFAEEIFGPAKSYECHCGKYKKNSYSGTVCDKCGVEVTSKSVRRERMGYITLACPCTHIWYLKGTPSKIALILDVPPKDLEEVVYFQSHIVLNPGQYCLDHNLLQKKQVLDERAGRDIFQEILKSFMEGENPVIDPKQTETDDYKKCQRLINSMAHENEPYDFETAARFIKKLVGAEFGWGADAVKTLLHELDPENIDSVTGKSKLDVEFETIEKAIRSYPDPKNQKRIKLMKRLDVVESFRNSKNKPEWMILDVIPVTPPDLRPLLQLDGGRYATSDINELYRRVITRNSLLKRLMDQKAPTVILVNQKRMVQEAVDALIDNGRRNNKPLTGVSGRPLKSLSSTLKGKQGRFRLNLLGKRVDYSGRSVICVGPELRLDECGLPREMAIQLFKPFIMSELMKDKYAANIKIAEQMITRYDDKVYDVLEKIVPNHPVLLNRAPTLHRLGIQAFRPVLVDGRAMRLHPLVCPGFNADFDGDQMAVHVPLSREAQQEAFDLMISSRNILSPRDAKVIAIPVQDVDVGHYYLTSEQTPDDFLSQADAARNHGDVEEAEKFERFARMDGHVFRNFDEVMRAYQTGVVHTNNRIAIPAESLGKYGVFTEEQNSKYLITTVGKLIFNDMFPSDFPYVNDAPSHCKGELKSTPVGIDWFFVPKGTDIKDYLKNHWNPTKPVDKSELSAIINALFLRYKSKRTSWLLDKIKDTGYYYCTKLGLTISITDINTVEGRDEILAEGDKKVAEINDFFNMGLITDASRHNETLDIWTKAKEAITDKVKEKMACESRNPVFMMANAKARGSVNNFVQLIGTRGLMAGPNNKTIEIPVKDCFRMGMSVNEYFTATHGARKGMTDTALKTADSGYLTRRLVDVSHSVVIRETDCGCDHGFWVEALYDDKNKRKLSVADRCYGRYSCHDICDKNGNVIIPANTYLDKAECSLIKGADLERVEIRSLLTCETKDGVCAHCYGLNMATGEMCKIGDTVGIMAAQSIGEPGTQLTLRTFHEGGTAGSDITQGLPRVQELLEVRNPKGECIMTEIDGTVTDITNKNGRDIISITGVLPNNDKSYTCNYNSHVIVKVGDVVKAGDALTIGSKDPKKLLDVCGVEKTERYLIDQVQNVYQSQGIDLSDKHLEVIVRQMMKKMLISDGGDTKMISGSRVDLPEFTSMNQQALAHGLNPAVGTPMILGVTKAALDTTSFLSSASFQETTRVLTDAAIKGKVDELKGLKENVMLGKLIPAGTTIDPLPAGENFVAEERLSKSDFYSVQSGFSDTEYHDDYLDQFSGDQQTDFTGEVLPMEKPGEDNSGYNPQI